MSLSGITVRFGGITALQDVDLQVDAGEVLRPHRAERRREDDALRCDLRHPHPRRRHASRSAAHDVTRTSAVQRARRGLRRTFQRVQTFGWLSVEDNVLAALDWNGGGGGLVADLVSFPTRRRRERERRERVAEVLELCGLTAVRRRDPRERSRSGWPAWSSWPGPIVDTPRVLLLDEPTSGLDENEAARLGERIQEIREHDSCAVLLVEHDVGFVMRQCDRIVVLHLGEVLAVGEPHEIQGERRGAGGVPGRGLTCPRDLNAQPTRGNRETEKVGCRVSRWPRWSPRLRRPG